MKLQSFEVFIPPARWLEWSQTGGAASAAASRRKRSGFNLQPNQNSLVIKSGCWKSPHVSLQTRVGEYKSRMQKPNSSPPCFSSLLSSSSVWNRESGWMRQGVGCGSFSTTQMFFFFLSLSLIYLFFSPARCLQEVEQRQICAKHSPLHGHQRKPFESIITEYTHWMIHSLHFFLSFPSFLTVQYPRTPKYFSNIFERNLKPVWSWYLLLNWSILHCYVL